MKTMQQTDSFKNLATPALRTDEIMTKLRVSVEENREETHVHTATLVKARLRHRVHVRFQKAIRNGGKADRGIRPYP